MSWQGSREDRGSRPDERPTSRPLRLDDRSQVSPRRSDGSRGIAGPHLGRFRLTPTRVTLVIAFVGSAAFLLYGMTVRDASQIPLLAAGALVLGIVFAALAVAAVAAIYGAAREGRSGAAFWRALGGGVVALISIGCFTLAAILFLLLRGPA